MLFATLETRRKWTELTSNDKDQQAKICQYSEKKHLKISKDAKFDCDLVKSNEYIATQSNWILQTFAWCPANVCKIL